MLKLKLRLKQAKVLFFIYFFRLFAWCAPKHLWVICERGDDARDNAYWLYKYIKENHPSQKICYIIDFSSSDYEKVAEDAVKLGSLKYFWALAVSEKIISTHYGAGIYFFTHKFFNSSGLGKKFYFLQHGVIHNEMVQLHGDHVTMRRFFCGAKPEADWIAGHFGHPEGVVQYTGLARFDRLHNCEKKNQILVMPTWRAYIEDETQFLESEYFRRWQRFLDDPMLLEMLEQQDLTLVFYPHYEIQKYITSFRSGNDRVVVADFAHYDVQTLLKESALLVSDYSSVVFDFAYMRKPVVYYQFDEERFFAGEHYGRGYFDFKTMGFGKVCMEQAEAVEELCRICGRGMTLDALYSERVDQFFPLYDTANSARIYRLIAEDIL